MRNYDYEYNFDEEYLNEIDDDFHVDDATEELLGIINQTARKLIACRGRIIDMRPGGELTVELRGEQFALSMIETVVWVSAYGTVCEDYAYYAALIQNLREYNLPESEVDAALDSLVERKLLAVASDYTFADAMFRIFNNSTISVFNAPYNESSGSNVYDYLDFELPFCTVYKSHDVGDDMDDVAYFMVDACEDNQYIFSELLFTLDRRNRKKQQIYNEFRGAEENAVTIRKVRKSLFDFYHNTPYGRGQSFNLKQALDTGRIFLN